MNQMFRKNDPNKPNESYKKKKKIMEDRKRL